MSDIVIQPSKKQHGWCQQCGTQFQDTNPWVATTVTAGAILKYCAMCFEFRNSDEKQKKYLNILAGIVYSNRE